MRKSANAFLKSGHTKSKRERSQISEWQDSGPANHKVYLIQSLQKFGNRPLRRASFFSSSSLVKGRYVCTNVHL